VSAPSRLCSSDTKSALRFPNHTQHIVLVHAVISCDSFDGPPLPPDPNGPPVHAAAHTDLLLFTAPEGPADD
jgi:hypothetical protein